MSSVARASHSRLRCLWAAQKNKKAFYMIVPRSSLPCHPFWVTSSGDCQLMLVKKKKTGGPLESIHRPDRQCPEFSGHPRNIPNAALFVLPRPSASQTFCGNFDAHGGSIVRWTVVSSMGNQLLPLNCRCAAAAAAAAAQPLWYLWTAFGDGFPKPSVAS